MPSYEIFIKNSQEKIVKVGFSWPAFFFSWLWAAGKGLVLVAVLGYMVSITMHFFIRTLFLHFYPAELLVGWSALHYPANFYNLCHLSWQVIFSLIFAHYGNQWQRLKLLRQGYALISTLQAKNRKMAKDLYLLSTDMGEVP